MNTEETSTVGEITLGDNVDIFLLAQKRAYQR